ncbi:RNA-directed DNA polymerase, eukaryota, reverse transcriptase zinc-binding domain protein [Tanacetum coccineum]
MNDKEVPLTFVDQNLIYHGEDSDVDEVPETVFDESSGQKKKQSEDPFRIYPLLDKQRKVNSHGDTVNGESLKYPPGFTPIDATEMMGQSNENVEKQNGDRDQTNNVEEPLNGRDDCSDNMGNQPDDLDSGCSGRFKKSVAPRTGGSILCLMEEVVKVGQTMGYNMEGCVKDIMNIIESRGASSETKMESMELITIKSCWGNYAFDYVHSDAVVWVKTGANLLIVVVYAPHDLKDKCMLWDYLTHVSNHWDGEVMMMGDFNEVRFKSDRFGSFFNERGADMFNSFISNASLEEVPLGGCAYTWCHKSASKMSKLDRFLISENLMHKCPNICAITLDRFISDHRPILLRESSFDYGPTPFRFFHYWMEVDGFNEFVIDSWRVAPGDQSNGMRNMLFKLKFLKSKIREWINVFKYNSKAELIRLKGELQAVDGDIDNGNGSDEVVSKRTKIINSILRLNKINFSSPSSVMLDWMYVKIIAKILTNRLVGVIGDIVNEVQSAFIADRQILDGPFILNEVMHWCTIKKKQALIFKVDFEKAYDSVRWDFLDEVLQKFRFGNKWRMWIQSSLRSSRGFILVNGSPTEEFQLYRGLKQGDPLFPFLFILIMESLHLSFQRVVDASMFTGINLSPSVNLSHMFYADDAVFIGHWNDSNINTLVNVLECFYRASGLRINMCKSKIMGIHVEGDLVKHAASKLGCLILNTPFVYLGAKVGGKMSRVKEWNEVMDKVVSIEVLQQLESIRNRFFNGNDLGSKKAIWIKWSNVLADKAKGGLGVSSLYAINRGLMIKWLWGFYAQNTSLWVRVVKVIHGEEGKVGQNISSQFYSCWLNIVKDVSVLQAKGVNVMNYVRLKLGGAEQSQLDILSDMVREVGLVPMSDRYIWSLEGSGDFSVASIRKVIDDKFLPNVSSKTRWVKYVPIKVNILAWKVKMEALPVRFNLSRRGIDIGSIVCPVCESEVKTASHLFFKCSLLRQTARTVSSWWNVDYVGVNSYEEWFDWLGSLRLPAKLKLMLEGVFYVSLHLSFSRTVDVGIFKGIQIGKDFTLSHLFYADDDWRMVRRES